MVQAQNISFSFGASVVFDQASFTVPTGYKVGLIGPNGAGKSTLLSLITKKEVPDTGKLDIIGNIGYVPQEVTYDQELDQSASVRDYLDPNSTHQDYQLETILAGLEMEHMQLSHSPKDLSGGQKTKLALAKAILAEPQILLLDEPTNFLDVGGKRWVMDLLSRYPHTLIIISHDLELLDKYIDKVIAINPQFKKIEEYTGNYTQAMKLKKEREEMQRRHIVNEQKLIKRLEESVMDMQSLKSEKGVRQRTVLKRRIARLRENLPELPAEIKKMKIKFQDPAWVGEIPLKVANISKSYSEKKILDNFTFYIMRGERMALVGPNGVGKSTLIKIAVGLGQPDDGEVITDPNLKLGYYSQEHETFDLDKRLIEVVRQDLHISEHQARPVLAKFMFTGDKIYQTVGSLSGGEKTRLSIALLLLHDYNLLVLDEPTTYLDVLSQRIILEALKDYKGAMLIVSHTEEFIKELQPSRYILLPDQLVNVWSDRLLDKVGEI